MMKTSQSIGLFDSGVGGLSILQEVSRALPNEHLIYLGDTARVPYGNKSAETIIRYSIENAEFLFHKNIKLLIVACHTSSAYALPKLRELFSIPIVGVIESGAQSAIQQTRNFQIAILGTKGTIQSNAYQEILRFHAPQASLFPVACPLFVPLVEEQWHDHAVTPLIIKSYLSHLPENKIDTAILGCTHYPALSSLIQAELGQHVSLINPAKTCAQEVVQILKEHRMLSNNRIAENEFYCSDDPNNFKATAEKLFGISIKNMKLKDV